MKMLLICLLNSIVLVLGTPKVIEHKFNYNNTYKYDVMYNVTVSYGTEQIMDFVEEDDIWSRFPSRVHFVCSNADPQLPVFIMATQPKGVVSWEYPQSDTYAKLYTMSHTLCPRDADSLNASQSRPTLHLSTDSLQNISVSVKVNRVHDFYIELNKQLNVNVTPTTPKYYYFSFENNPWFWTTHPKHQQSAFPMFNYTIPKNLVLMIDSEDDLCAVVSIQNDSCPIYDNENDVQRQGYRFTMTKRGGITLSQSKFPHGFYVALITKNEDVDCELSDITDIMQTQDRSKNFTLKVIATISYEEYLVAALITLALVIVFFIFVVLHTYCSCKCKDEIIVAEEIISPHRRMSNESAVSNTPIEETRRVDLESSSSDNELLWKEEPPSILTVELLSRRGCTRLDNRSQRYLWLVLIVAMIYALPVVQLLGTYQHMVFQTGDEDVCYYNFLCSHPLGMLSDFNHVYSNVGYVILGLLFMVQVLLRQKRYERQLPQFKNLGIPPHFGLLHGLGVALVAEGLLSACYHLCPNHMNFQFDSSFMYVTAILSMVKLYQNRHPDVNARAHHTFTLIAFVFALGVFGTLYPSIVFWIMFTAFHIISCLLLTLNIYYVGRFKFDCGIWKRAYTFLRVNRGNLWPKYKARAVLLIIANLANCALAVYGVMQHNKKDFSRHLLAILLGNTVLYTLFYVCMKLLHRERFYIHTIIYFIGANLVWFGALYLFLDSKTKWSISPAASRVYNEPCTILHFYDSHDLWHLASAAAMFLCFNLLLTIDDPLYDTPRANIPVF